MYNESFYQDVLKRNNESLNKFAYYKGFIVGAVCARIEDHEKDERTYQRLYIMTLAVLAAYRGRGIGACLLESILDYCKEHPMIQEIALHVQISNTDAIRFYERFDFEQGEMVENYYRRIDPPHCYLLYKTLHPPPSEEEAQATETDEEDTKEAASLKEPKESQDK